MQKKASNKTLLKNTGIIAIGNMSTKLINFILLPMYTMLISVEDYGIIDLLSTYVMLIMIVVSLQLYEAAFRFTAVERENHRESCNVITNVFFVTVVISVIYILLFFCVSPWIIIPEKWYLLIQVIVNVLFMLVVNVVRGIGDNRVYAFTNFLSAAIALLLNVLFLVVLHLGAMSMLWAYILGPFIGGLFAIASKRLWQYIDWHLVSINQTLIYLKYAIPLVPNELSWWVVHASDRAIVSMFIGVAANGLIAVASKFSSIYTTIFSVFNTAWTEQCIIHFSESGGKEYIAKTMITVIKLFTCFTLILIAFMPFVFIIMVNDKYYDALGLIPLYFLAVYFNVIIGLVSPIYLAHNETGKVAITTAVAAILNLGVDLVLIQRIGIYSAPISSLVAYLVIGIWRIIDVKKRYIKLYFPRSVLFSLLLMGIYVLLAFYSENRIFQASAVLITLVYSAFLNRGFIQDGIQLVKNKF